MDILEQLNNYQKCFPKENQVVSKTKTFIHNNKNNIYNRKNMVGHITANGIVINKGNILMIRHPFLNMELLPGGHVEKDENPLMAAIREVKEETGFSVRINELYSKMNAPIHIDIHAIPKNESKKEDMHIHYNFTYIFDYDGNILKADNELPYNWLEPNYINNNVVTIIINKIKEVKFNEWFFER